MPLSKAEEADMQARDAVPHAPSKPRSFDSVSKDARRASRASKEAGEKCPQCTALFARNPARFSHTAQCKEAREREAAAWKAVRVARYHRDVRDARCAAERYWIERGVKVVQARTFARYGITDITVARERLLAARDLLQLRGFGHRALRELRGQVEDEDNGETFGPPRS
jgi:hypothetical protein